MSRQSSVVVGWDGRPQSGHVLEVAADEASRQGLRLAIVTLVPSPDPTDPADPTGPEPRWPGQEAVDACDQARRALAQARSMLAQTYADLEVSTHYLHRAYVHDDVEPFASARLLVVGEYPGPAPGRSSAPLIDCLVRATGCQVVRVRPASDRSRAG
ncbi:universal stress protein [Kineosporia sp. NBRC 101731]|uniref:universal stress protein n=1 Tax=Kineosporia sp. NBRC 101731 TaxID=3032199 RepID=UPI00249FD4F0|nr:universal stress protein [Kineosporia sp. NBRC 101731]GLY30927.1 hypothetical protein Kisp02_42920 [Kineosporia sp. NBRC 101731]